MTSLESLVPARPAPHVLSSTYLAARTAATRSAFSSTTSSGTLSGGSAPRPHHPGSEGVRTSLIYRTRSSHVQRPALSLLACCVPVAPRAAYQPGADQHGQAAGYPAIDPEQQRHAVHDPAARLRLEAAEREITHAALILLHESPISPSYDLPHLREVHKRIFGDIYEWAGQIRTVAMAKGAMFCLPQYIDSSAAIIFRELHDEGCLRGLSREAFVGRLAYYLGEVNALHPFREGNGRARRAFFAQLARSTGFTLAWQHLDAARNVEASAAIMRGDPEPMRKMLDALVRDGT
jgi:cell filamentation protein